LAREGKLAEALDQFQQAALAQPANPKVHNMLGVVLTQMGRLEDADKAYTRALELAPGLMAARKNRAVNAFSRKLYPEAAREFEALARLEPKDFVPRLFLGLLAEEDSRLDDARQQLGEARRLAPHNGRVLIALARVEMGLGQREAAIGAAAAALQAAALSDAEKFELGALLAQHGANRESRGIFLELRQKDPRSYEVGFNLALVSYRDGQMEDALRTVDEMLAAGHRTGELLNLRAWLLAKLLRPGPARESLDQALALEPLNADHHLDLSTLLMNANERTAALRVLTEAMDRIPGDARLPVAAGLIAQSTGDRDEAERWFRKGLEVYPSSPPASLALANLLYEAGRTSESLDVLARGIELVPNSPLLHYAYGALLLDSAGEGERKKLELAKVHLLRAAETSPYYANTYYLLGRLSLKLDDMVGAQGQFERACSLEPKHVGALYQLSQIAQRRGDHRRAAELAAVIRGLRAGVVEEQRQTFTALLQESLRAERNSNLP
jgi:tetratricopeptide (TPR) repeat protein